MGKGMKVFSEVLLHFSFVVLFVFAGVGVLTVQKVILQYVGLVKG